MRNDDNNHLLGGAILMATDNRLLTDEDAVCLSVDGIFVLLGDILQDEWMERKCVTREFECYVYVFADKTPRYG